MQQQLIIFQKNRAIKECTRFIRKICNILNLSQDTKNTSIFILKKIIKSTKLNQSINYYHLITVCCLWISNKFHDTIIMSLDFIIFTIFEGKFDKKLILETEIKILKFINYKLF